MKQPVPPSSNGPEPAKAGASIDAPQPAPTLPTLAGIEAKLDAIVTEIRSLDVSILGSLDALTQTITSTTRDLVTAANNLSTSIDHYSAVLASFKTDEDRAPSSRR